MSNESRPLNFRQKQAVRRLPCDGIKRFKVGKTKGLAYSEAWEAIFKATKCERFTSDDTKKREENFTPGALRRLGELNAGYIKIARQFIIKEFCEMHAKALKAKETPAAPAP